MLATNQIKHYFKNAELRINQDTDEIVFKKVAENLSVMLESRWRTIMKSPITKCTAAAVMIIACLTGFFLLTSTGSGIALADVVERIEQITACRFQMDASAKIQDMEEKLISQATILTSDVFGTKIIIDLCQPTITSGVFGTKDPNRSLVRVAQEIYVLPFRKTITTLMPNEKKYSKLEFDEASFDGWREQNDPRAVIKGLLEFEHTNLGRSTIDGIEVEGFRTTDPDGPMGQAEVEIWVDVETTFPVRMEIHKTGRNDTYMCVTFHAFQWDVPVDEAEFEPVIPDDYTQGQPMMQILPGKKPSR